MIYQHSNIHILWELPKKMLEHLKKKYMEISKIIWLHRENFYIFDANPHI